MEKLDHLGVPRSLRRLQRGLSSETVSSFEVGTSSV